MIENKKGMVEQIWIVLIIFGVLIGLMVILWVMSILAPPITSLMDDASADIITTAQTSGDGNLSTALSTPFIAFRGILSQFEWASYIIIMGLVIALIAMCFFVRTYPFLIAFWIIGIIILALLSLFLTDAYQGIIADDYMSSSITNWETTHYIISNLPMIIVAIGLLGGAVMFVVMSRDSESEATGI